MRTITTWQCEICDATFNTPEKATACEARGRIETSGHPGLVWCKPEWPWRLFVVVHPDPNNTPHGTNWLSLIFGEFQQCHRWSPYAYPWAMDGWIPARLDVPWVQGAIRALAEVQVWRRSQLALPAFPTPAAPGISP